MLCLMYSVLALVVVIPLEGSVKDETDDCVFDSNLMTCKDTIPTEFPSNVTDVEIVDLRPEKLVKNVFCHTSWTNVSKLTISCIELTCSVKFELLDPVFYCLENLTHLTLQYDVLTNLSGDTFSGLQNLISLDLSRCLRLCTPALETALTNISSLPKLSRLILVNTGNIFCSLEITQAFVDLLGERNISMINLSNSSIKFVNSDMTPLCDTLKTLNISHSSLVKSSVFHSLKECKSLRTLDVTGMKFPKTPPLPPILKLINFHFVANNSVGPFRGLLGPFFKHATTVYANNMVSKDHAIYLQNCSLYVTSPNDLKTLEICGHNFETFDLLMNFTYNNLNYLKLCNNNMGNIGENVFKFLKFLKGISLANNRLSRSTSFNKTFTNLFHANGLLLEIDLSNNQFHDIPPHTFARTTLLERLYLAGNKFKQITFDVDQLINLKLLDMRNNHIERLNAASRNSLDLLYEKLKTKNETGNFQVDLRENPFTCVCKSKSFMRWFVNSPIFSTTRSTYHCQAGETTLPMNTEAIKEAEEDCERPIRRRRMIILLSVLPASGLMILTITVIKLIKHRKKNKKQRDFEDKVRLIQAEDFKHKYLVFLSYSSADDIFVHGHVIDQLEVS